MARILFVCDLQALAVFILYVRCTAIDPADPGILIEPDKISTYKSHNEIDMPGECSVPIRIYWVLDK